MITFELRGEQQPKRFNLKSFGRERALHAAWKTFQGDPEYLTKKFKITTTTGETFIVDVAQIRNCIFEEVEYADVEQVKEDDLNALRNKTAKRR